jgi:hypothetical protein
VHRPLAYDADSHRMNNLRVALLILMGSLLLVAGCGAEEPDPATDAQAQNWVLAYTKQLDRWADGAAQMAAAIDQQAWRRLGTVVRRMGRDGDRLRERFEHVPAALAGGDDLYALLIDAGDAASAWARIYEKDPPPYLGNADGENKSQALADAAADFQAKVNAAVNATR